MEFVKGLGFADHKTNQKQETYCYQMNESLYPIDRTNLTRFRYRMHVIKVHQSTNYKLTLSTETLNIHCIDKLYGVPMRAVNL